MKKTIFNGIKLQNKSRMNFNIRSIFYLLFFSSIFLLQGCSKDEKNTEITLSQVEELGKKYGFEFKQSTFKSNEKPLNVKDLAELETVLKRIDGFRSKKSMNNLKLVPISEPLPPTWLQEDGSYAVEPGMNGGGSIYVNIHIIPGLTYIRNNIVLSFNGTSVNSITSFMAGLSWTGSFTQTGWNSSSFGTSSVRYFNVSIDGYLNYGINMGPITGYFATSPYHLEYQIKKELKFNKYIYSVRPLY